MDPRPRLPRDRASLKMVNVLSRRERPMVSDHLGIEMDKDHPGLEVTRGRMDRLDRVVVADAVDVEGEVKEDDVEVAVAEEVAE